MGTLKKVLVTFQKRVTADGMESESGEHKLESKVPGFRSRLKYHFLKLVKWFSEKNIAKKRFSFNPFLLRFYLLLTSKKPGAWGPVSLAYPSSVETTSDLITP